RRRGDPPVRRRGVAPETARARSPGARPHLPDHHALPEGLARAQPGAVAARTVEVALGCLQAARPLRRTERGIAARPETGGSGASREAVDRRSILRGEAPPRNRHGARAEAQGPAARRAVRRAVARGARRDEGTDSRYSQG